MNYNRTIEFAAVLVLCLTALWVLHLLFSEAAWLHPEILGSASYVWLYPGQESVGTMLRKVFDWKAFDPNVNRVRPFNDIAEVVDALTRPAMARAFGAQPAIALSTWLAAIASPMFLFGYLRRRLKSNAGAFALVAVFLSTIGFLSLTVAYIHPAKRLNLVLLCSALYFAERMRDGERGEVAVAASVFASFFADELGLANWAIIGIMYWPEIVGKRYRLASFLLMPPAFIVTSGAILPLLYAIFSVHGAWNALGDTKKATVFAYLLTSEFWQCAAIQQARSILSTFGIRTHIAATEIAALAVITLLPFVHCARRRLSAYSATRDPLLLSTIALVATSVFATLLDWYPFPHEVSYLGSFNYYYHSTIVVSVLAWLTEVLRNAASVRGRDALIVLLSPLVVIANFLMFEPVNRLVQIIHYYPYPRHELFAAVEEARRPVAHPHLLEQAFEADVKAIFGSRPSGFSPILRMVERTPIMTETHVRNLPHVFYPYRMR